MIERKIIFNGRTYASPEDMPPDERAAYQRALQVFEDRNRNGVPDALETSDPTVVQQLTDRRIVLNGREYSSVEEMPPEVRSSYEAALRMLEDGKSGSVVVSESVHELPHTRTTEWLSIDDPRSRGSRMSESVRHDHASGRSSAGRWIAVLLAVIAVLLALLLLRNFGVL